MERDWEVIWKRFLTRKLTEKKISFDFWGDASLVKNHPLLAEINVCIHRDVTIMLARWSPPKTH